MVQCVVSEKEAKILEDIEDVGFGEIYDVLADEGLRTKRVFTTIETERFFRQLRKIKKFTRVIIHDSMPTLAEYRDQTPNGRECLRKVKFTA